MSKKYKNINQILTPFDHTIYFHSIQVETFCAWNYVKLVWLALELSNIQFNNFLNPLMAYSGKVGV